MTTVCGTSVEIPTPDGVSDAYLTHPDTGGSHPGVLFYMDAFGLRPHLREMADRLASAGYTVLVPNVFYRHGRAPVVELPEFIDPAARPEIFERIFPIMQSLTPELAMRDAEAYLRWLGDCPQSTGGPLGITGYCMGAGLALRTAGTHPTRVAAAAGFHGETWPPRPQTARTCSPTASPRSSTSATPTRTRHCRPSRSTASTTHSPQPGCATTARSAPAPTTASPRPTPPPTTPKPPNATGQRCWPSSSALSERHARGPSSPGGSEGNGP